MPVFIILCYAYELLLNITVDSAYNVVEFAGANSYCSYFFAGPLRISLRI